MRSGPTVIGAAMYRRQVYDILSEILALCSFAVVLSSSRVGEHE